MLPFSPVTSKKTNAIIPDPANLSIRHTHLRTNDIGDSISHILWTTRLRMGCLLNQCPTSTPLTILTHGDHMGQMLPQSEVGRHLLTFVLGGGDSFTTGRHD
ncbi:hypothetical protein CEXT_577541 [Caerostris extrusa]|uniref:Uncharacterized protein n=1 Tax=Caerostris extrusa TaxID=172846 RepID=A0AAV4R6X8_CAEEX|nr:hypothetical protein CEXT_577541 [Caerostris extrusa]